MNSLTDGVCGGSRFERQGAFAGFIPANMVAPLTRNQEAVAFEVTGGKA